MTEDLFNETYLSSLDLYNNFNNQILLTFSSIKESISSEDDDW